ncbi:hypothetical protein XENTR_v10011100 [Xenopus tropicalis]|nr:hypothetical protein XENTR_v10011100 [Xenopus tropicalis]
MCPLHMAIWRVTSPAGACGSDSKALAWQQALRPSENQQAKLEHQSQIGSFSLYLLAEFDKMFYIYKHVY